jgi:pimeloyl-ACP methyl ester carboxylesterase
MATQFLNVQDGTLAYDDTGAGPLVICVPGMGDLRGEYRFLAPRLVAAGYRVVTLDVRGHGETSVRWPDYSVAGVGADILSLARALNAGPATIIGTSMAAGAAVWAAAEGPELVAGLVLVGPFVRGGGSRLLARVMAAVFSGPWGAGLWTTYYHRLYPTQKPADFEAYVATLKANLREPGRLAALRQMLLARKDASDARLERVAAPTLVLMGTRDPDFPDPAKEAALVAKRTHGTAQMIEEAGHYPHAEMPDITGARVIAFLRQVQQAGEEAHHGA